MTDLDVRCYACDGTGLVPDSDWVRWDRELGRTIHGLAGRARLDAIEAFKRENPPPDRPQEVACGQCEGRGYVLLDDGRRLLEFLRRHWGQS